MTVNVDGHSDTDTIINSLSASVSGSNLTINVNGRSASVNLGSITPPTLEGTITVTGNTTGGSYIATFGSVYFEQSSSTTTYSAQYYYSGDSRTSETISRQGVDFTFSGNLVASQGLLSAGSGTFSRITDVSRITAKISAKCTGYGYVRMPVVLGVSSGQGAFSSANACSTFLDFYVSNNSISEMSMTKCQDGSNLIGKYWTAQTWSSAFDHSNIMLSNTFFDDYTSLQISSTPFD